MCNQNILSCSFWLSPLLLLWRFAKKHPSHFPVTTYQMPGDSGQNRQSSPGSANPSLSWTQHTCFLTTFMAFSQTGSNLSKSLLYRRPQMGHVTPGAASKVQTEKCFLIPWPAAQYAAQYSVKLCCHKGALQAGVQFAHHKIWVSPTPPGSFLATLLSGERAWSAMLHGVAPSHTQDLDFVWTMWDSCQTRSSACWGPSRWQPDPSTYCLENQPPWFGMKTSTLDKSSPSHCWVCYALLTRGTALQLPVADCKWLPNAWSLVAQPLLQPPCSQPPRSCCPYLPARILQEMVSKPYWSQ